MDSNSDSLDLAQKLSIRFPLLSDPDLVVAMKYGVAMEGNDIAVPSVFIIDTAGRIRWSYIGERKTDRPLLDTILEQVDAVRAAPVSQTST